MIERLIRLLFIAFYGILAVTFVFFNVFLANLGIIKLAATNPSNILAMVLLMAGVLVFFMERHRQPDKRIIMALKIVFLVLSLPVTGFLIGALETYQLNF